jgi:hypothetical protein
VPLLAQIITLRTMLAAITMPVAIALAAWFQFPIYLRGLKRQR